MTDADLRRWLRLQAMEAVGFVAHAVVSKGAGALRAALADCATRRERLVIVDAVSEADLLAIGGACEDAPLITGGSGIALGLPANFIRKGLAAGIPVRVPGVEGMEAVLAGSCSARTLEQIEAHRASHPALAIEPAALLEGRIKVADVVAFVQSNAGRAPLVYSSAPAAQVASAQQAHGRDKLALAIEALFAAAARALVAAGVRRLVVAGGETSGAVVSALALGQLAIGPELAQGDRPLALALKSGNFGERDFFERALRVLATGG